MNTLTRKSSSTTSSASGASKSKSTSSNKTSNSTTSKPAEKCSCCKTTDAPKPSSKKTIIKVTYDCGFPNTLYIRGEGCSTLSWNKGAPLKNISKNEWIWESTRPCAHIEFKVLLNDEVFENGNNHSISYGDQTNITPRF